MRAVDAGVEYALHPNIWLEAIFGYYRFGGKQGGADLSVYQLSANVKAYAGGSWPVRPFVNAGIGAYWFDPGGTNGGYGLKGMRDRVSQVGGTVEVASVPGRGTEVSAEVPA